MRTHLRLRVLATITAGAALLTSPLFGAGKIDLSQFRGNYKGSLSIVFQGSPFSGTAKVRFKVPRSGGSAKVSINGKVSSGTIVPVRAMVVLKRNGKMRVSKIDLGNNIPTPAARGKFKQKPATALEGTAGTSLAGQELGFDCAVKVKGRGRSKKLRGNLEMTLRGNPIATVSLEAKS